MTLSNRGRMSCVGS
ncbi:Protein of unknown function [Pyronema omphalodes CBS 100304]|uniref:Uncharacterized protein n=1 Tax=Pyronema omphalodes (strain CBS 100304) TaxID=1076935 RepID=U4LMI2_PYROM|nr:Protein of unknown function [Pyronema omphalodes CBS 100304]